MKTPKLNVYLLFSIAFMLGVSDTVTSQNLISNPSFENIHTSISKMEMEMQNFSIMKNWEAISKSPDAYHPGLKRVKFHHKSPSFLNQFGSQEPRTGEGKAGLYVSGSNYKEGIITKLNRSLSAGKYYYFHMYVSLGEGVSNTCTSSIGAYFSKRTPKITETTKLPLHVASTKMICDTKGWTKICGVYKAKGTENYISIGYFSNNPKGKSLKSGASGAFGNAYYFLDDVMLMELNDPNGSSLQAVCDFNFEFTAVQYPVGEEEISEEMRKTLEPYLKYLQAFKVNHVAITVYTNDAETKEDTRLLAEERVESIKEYFADGGISQHVIKVESILEEIADPEAVDVIFVPNSKVIIEIEGLEIPKAEKLIEE